MFRFFIHWLLGKILRYQLSNTKLYWQCAVLKSLQVLALN